MHISGIDQVLLLGLWAWEPQLNMPQTLPGIDISGVELLSVEFGAEMWVFGSKE